ncbi:MAG: ATP-binding protein [Gammaproteobacteria bacterium]|nr:ATP-binding protein [Gammaproteobacteria bacterium]
MTVEKRIILQIESCVENISLVGFTINCLCREHGMDEMTSYHVQTATTEAVNNAIIHAYQCQPDNKVSVEWILKDQTVYIEVSDHGKGMEKAPPDIVPIPEAESGRGWWIIRRWMDKAIYKSIEGVNYVSMSKKIVPRQNQLDSLT